MAFKVLILPGDGVGPEIMTQAENVLSALEDKFQLGIEIEHGVIGGQAIDQSGEPLPEEVLRCAKEADSILLGAVGGPKWDQLATEIRPEKGLLKLRKALKLFANLRPAILNPHLVEASSLKPEYVSGLDILIVRELTGGLYFREPRGIKQLDNEREGYNTLAYNETEIKQISKVAFDLAKKRKGLVTSVDKANVLEVSQLWREVVTNIGNSYPEIHLDHMYIDNAAMQLVKAPKQFDVIVTGNLFGDILSDCAAMLTGSIGMLPSASMDINGKGLYEPVHGSAPDIAGLNSVNPIAMIQSLVMMLRYSMQREDAAIELEQAIDSVLEQGLRTKDIATIHSKSVSTNEMGAAIVSMINTF